MLPCSHITDEQIILHMIRAETNIQFTRIFVRLHNYYESIWIHKNDFGNTNSCIFSNNFKIQSYFSNSMNYILYISSLILSRL